MRRVINPFVAGAHVAVKEGKGDTPSYHEAWIDKVYVSGNFVVVDDAYRQQWRPTWDSATGWIASPTGPAYGHHRSMMLPWDNGDTSAKVAESGLREERRDRLRRLKVRVDMLHHSNVTEAVLSALERALSTDRRKRAIPSEDQ